MESFDDTFAAELRELRPTPRPAFTAELDQRAATGFPRRPDDGGGKSLWARLRAWLAGLTPRRALVPGGAIALAAVIVATAVVAISNSGSGSGGEVAVTHKTIESVESGAEESSTSAGAAPATGSTSAKAPHVAQVPEASAEKSGENGLTHASGTAGGEESGKVEFEAEPESAAGPEGGPSLNGPISGVAGNGVNGGTAGGSFSPRNREVERSASIVLGTTPDKLSEASARVYEAVHSANGIVLHSSIRGNHRDGEASFELLIPSGKLNSALAAFSGIAEVRSRHDATQDITAPTVSLSEKLQDSNARIEGLLAQLGEAETDFERELAEGELRGERGHHAALRASLERLEDRADMSKVSLRIVSGHGAGVVPGGGGSGGQWGVGDALGDAGHILAVAGGVVIVGLAILAPIALILLAGWLVNRLRVRHLRERTLG